jgi:hypothetical protein
MMKLFTLPPFPRVRLLESPETLQAVNNGRRLYPLQQDLSMKLRDYFNMKFEGELAWPHLNLMASGDKALLDLDELEEAVIRSVHLRKTVEYYTHLDIEVEYEGVIYSTALLRDEGSFLKSFYEFLRMNEGKSLKEIGKLEFPS